MPPKDGEKKGAETVRVSAVPGRHFVSLLFSVLCCWDDVMQPLSTFQGNTTRQKDKKLCCEKVWYAFLTVQYAGGGAMPSAVNTGGGRKQEDDRSDGRVYRRGITLLACH
eukprot:1101651-Rhodomonas_salina.1